MPTLYGYDTDDPEAEGEFGTCGVGVSSLADMEVLLDGLPLDRVSTSMTINSPAAPIWAMYIVAAEKAGVPRAALEGTPQNDILKEFVAQKEFLFPPEPSMRLVTDTIEFGTREMPRWNTISISGYHIREAGSTAVQELAFTIADGMAYVEAAIERGLRVDDFAPRLSFFFNSHSDFFEEIAKFRASRRIWYKLMTERYRAENERSTWMRFHTQTAGVSLTPQQPLNNLTRVALQALAAVLGGTQSLHTDAYDEALAVPTGRGGAPRPPPAADHRRGDRRREHDRPARRHRGSSSRSRTRPSARSGATSTRSTGAAAWSRRSSRATRSARSPTRPTASSASSTRGERRIVGVNAYVDRVRGDARSRSSRCRPGRSSATWPGSSGRAASATPEAVDAALAGLREAARRPGSSDDNLMPHFIRCAAGLRDARRAVRRPARGLRRVPRAGGGLERVPRRPLVPRGRARRLAARSSRCTSSPTSSSSGPSRRCTAGPAATSWPTSSRGSWSRSTSRRSSRSARRRRRRTAPTPTGSSAAAMSSTTRSSADWAAHAARRAPVGVRARRRASSAGYLTVVPEARWIKNADHQRFFIDETLDHYDEHRKDLDAILARGRDAGLVTAATLAAVARRRRGGARGRRADVGRRRIDGRVVDRRHHVRRDQRRPGRVPARPAWSRRRRLRTPDTADSARGADWVAFSPPELDQHAIDRATAWLASAWRRADGES